MGLGAGDLNIKAECRLLIQTCSISDRWLYYPNEVSSTTYGNTRFFNDFSMPNTGNWEFTAQLKSNKGYIELCPSTNGQNDGQGNTRYIGIGANSNNQKLSALGFTSDIGTGLWYTNGSWGTSNYHTVKMVREGDTYKFYIDGSLHTTSTSTGFGNYTQLYIFSWINGSGNFYMKNISIKSL